MSYTLTQLIGQPAIQDIVESPMGGVPTNSIIDAMLKLTRPIEGDVAEWDIVANARTTAPINARGAAARKLGQLGISSMTMKCLSSFNEITFKQELLSRLRAFGKPEVQQKAAQVVDMQMKEFKRKHENTRVAVLTAMLTGGTVYFDSAGFLLPSSSGAALTVSFQIPAELAYNDSLFNSETLGDWSSASTDVPKGIAALQKYAYVQHGRPIKKIMYGSAIPGWFSVNNSVANWLHGSSTLGDKLSSGLIPEGFMYEGIEWVPGGHLFYIDESGTVQPWVGTDKIIALPDIDSSWFEIQEGTTVVPTSLGLFDDAPQAINGGLANVNGMYGYCKINDNPVAVQAFMGDCWLPCPKDVNCIIRADVKA